MAVAEEFRTGVEGAVVTETGVELLDLPFVAWVFTAVIEYVVLATAPVNVAGEVVPVVVGPLGLTVNVIDFTDVVVPPDHAILKLFDVAVGAVSTLRTCGIGGVVNGYPSDSADWPPAFIAAIITVLIEFTASPVTVADVGPVVVNGENVAAFAEVAFVPLLTTYPVIGSVPDGAAQLKVH